MLLWNQYKGQEWFELASGYCFHRFEIIESRFYEATRYVSINTENRATFSYEFASILRDCGSTFSSVMDAIVKGTGEVKPDIDTTIAHYRKFLYERIRDINRISLQIRPLFPKGMVLPFDGLNTIDDSPNWWDAYNNVKHNEYENYKDGSLENSVKALSSLALLGFYCSWFVSDRLFVNVGIKYPDDSIDMSLGRRLFP
jgi:hypothetical protein